MRKSASNSAGRVAADQQGEAGSAGQSRLRDTFARAAKLFSSDKQSRNRAASSAPSSTGRADDAAGSRPDQAQRGPNVLRKARRQSSRQVQDWDADAPTGRGLFGANGSVRGSSRRFVPFGKRDKRAEALRQPQFYAEGPATASFYPVETGYFPMPQDAGWASPWQPDRSYVTSYSYPRSGFRSFVDASLNFIQDLDDLFSGKALAHHFITSYQEVPYQPAMPQRYPWMQPPAPAPWNNPQAGAWNPNPPSPSWGPPPQTSWVDPNTSAPRRPDHSFHHAEAARAFYEEAAQNPARQESRSPPPATPSVAPSSASRYTPYTPPGSPASTAAAHPRVQIFDEDFAFNPAALGALLAAEGKDLREESCFLNEGHLDDLAHREGNIGLRVFHGDEPGGYKKVHLGDDWNNCAIHCLKGAKEVLSGRPPQKATDRECTESRDFLANNVGKGKSADEISGPFIAACMEEAEARNSPGWVGPDHDGDVANRTVKGYRRNVLTMLDHALDGRPIAAPPWRPTDGGVRPGRGEGAARTFADGAVATVGDPALVDERVALLHDGDHYFLLLSEPLWTEHYGAAGH